MTTKEMAVKAIKELPQGATMSDIQYRLYVIDKINKSKISIKKNGTISHVDALKVISKWRTR